jgi:hypothetical protein
VGDDADHRQVEDWKNIPLWVSIARMKFVGLTSQCWWRKKAEEVSFVVEGQTYQAFAQRN